jgi:hypothetical protein
MKYVNNYIIKIVCLLLKLKNKKLKTKTTKQNDLIKYF